MNPVRPGVVAVDLVDHYNRPRTALQRLAQHEPRLRLRAILSIDEQQHAINHAQRPLHFAAEIRVAGRVDNIDVVVAILERRVLGLDGDALLALQIHRIHDALLLRNGLVGAKRTRLLEQTVDERGLPVIHVRNNGDVPYLLHAIPSRRAAHYARNCFLNKKKDSRSCPCKSFLSEITSRPAAPLPRANRGRRNLKTRDL